MIIKTPWVLYLLYFPQKCSRKHKIVSFCRNIVGIKIVILTELYMTKYVIYIYFSGFWSQIVLVLCTGGYRMGTLLGMVLLYFGCFLLT